MLRVPCGLACVPACPSACTFVCPQESGCARMFRSSAWLTACLSAYVCSSVCLRLSPPVCLSLSVRLSVWLSTCRRLISLRPVLPCPGVVSCPALSRPVLPRPAPSRPVPSCPVLSCPSVSGSASVRLTGLSVGLGSVCLDCLLAFRFVCVFLLVRQFARLRFCSCSCFCLCFCAGIVHVWYFCVLKLSLVV